MDLGTASKRRLSPKIGVAGGTKPITRLIIIRWTSLPRPPVALPQDNSLGSKLRYLRQTQGITQNTLATTIGHPAQLIAKYERNEIKQPNPHILQKLASALKVKPNKLISIQDFESISNKSRLQDIYDYFIPPKDFGSKLKNLRLRRNIGQKELAEQLGLNRESIRRYEKNITRPNTNILTKLAETLNAPLEELQVLSYHKKRHFSKDLRKETQNADK